MARNALEAAADGFEFFLVHVQGEPRGGAETWQQAIPAEELRWYDEDLTRLVREHDDALRLQVVDDDPAETAAALAELLEE